MGTTTTYRGKGWCSASTDGDPDYWSQNFQGTPAECMAECLQQPTCVAYWFYTQAWTGSCAMLSSVKDAFPADGTGKWGVVYDRGDAAPNADAIQLVPLNGHLANHIECHARKDI